MGVEGDRVAELEWANYAATEAVARVTPGLEVLLRRDLVLTASDLLPSPDVNHACLLRTTPQAADALIDEVVQVFHSRGMPATVYLSPACSPPDLGERMLRHGFTRSESLEAWMTLEHLDTFPIPSPSPSVEVREISPEEAETFSRVFLAAFGMPGEMAPYMARLLAPSVGVPGVRHYLALVEGQAAGVCSLLTWGRFGVLGSAGVLPAFRRRRVASSLTVRAAEDARRQGVDPLLLQTTAGTPLERLLRISGFKRVFTRTCYTA